MPLQIPPTQIEAFKSFMELSDEKLDSVWRALQSAEPALSVSKLAESILPRVDVDIVQLRRVIAVTGALYLVRERQGFTVDQLANATVEAALKQELLKPDDSEGKAKLRERLARFVSLDRSLGVSSKATQILVRHKNPFTSARIFTDVRPIFTGDDNPVPQAAVCFHTLELITNTDGRPLSHYIVMDSSDLKSLKTIVERAIQKEGAIKDAMKALPLIEIKETEG